MKGTLRELNVSYLSGLKEGTSEVFLLDGPLELFVGSGRGSRINFPGFPGNIVAPHHATITGEEFHKDAEFILIPVEGNKIFVNLVELPSSKEAILSSGDVIQFGEEGPSIKIEIIPPPESPLEKNLSPGRLSLKSIALFMKDLLKEQFNKTTFLLLGGFIIALFFLYNPKFSAILTPLKGAKGASIEGSRGYDLSVEWRKASPKDTKTYSTGQQDTAAHSSDKAEEDQKRNRDLNEISEGGRVADPLKTVVSPSSADTTSRENSIQTSPTINSTLQGRGGEANQHGEAIRDLRVAEFSREVLHNPHRETIPLRHLINVARTDQAITSSKLSLRTCCRLTPLRRTQEGCLVGSATIKWKTACARIRH